jgi:hypothetical protein
MQVIPSKHFDTRIKPLALANGHGRYIAVTPEQLTSVGGCLLNQPPSFKWPPGVFYTHFYSHNRRLRLKKLLYIEFSRSSNGYFKPLLGPGGRFASETAARQFQKRSGYKPIYN